MDSSIEGEFYLKGFSPQSLTFIPGLNCVLASNGRGETRCIDVVTGHVQQSLGELSLYIQCLVGILSFIYVLCFHSGIYA